MEIQYLDYYVKFIFQNENGEVMSTSDVKMLGLIIDHDTNEKITQVYIGQKISFISSDSNFNSKIFEVFDIKIKQIYDNTIFIKKGYDGEDSNEPIGDSKECLFSIIIKYRLI